MTISFILHANQYPIHNNRTNCCLFTNLLPPLSLFLQINPFDPIDIIYCPRTIDWIIIIWKWQPDLVSRKTLEKSLIRLGNHLISPTINLSLQLTFNWSINYKTPSFPHAWLNLQTNNSSRLDCRQNCWKFFHSRCQNQFIIPRLKWGHETIHNRSIGQFIIFRREGGGGVGVPSVIHVKVVHQDRRPCPSSYFPTLSRTSSVSLWHWTN